MNLKANLTLLLLTALTMWVAAEPVQVATVATVHLGMNFRDVSSTRGGAISAASVVPEEYRDRSGAILEVRWADGVEVEFKGSYEGLQAVSVRGQCVSMRRFHAHSGQLELEVLRSLTTAGLRPTPFDLGAGTSVVFVEDTSNEPAVTMALRFEAWRLSDVLLLQGY